MDATRFDAVSRFFARRRLTRRQAFAQGGAGLAAVGLAVTGLSAVSAQDATPEPPAPDAAHGPTMLFVQSFQSGSIAPKAGTDGRYTITLEHGLGQTIYFSDRPDRIVGASPTPRFLEGLGFPADNPPNAALVVETALGETDLAVVELFNPVFEPAGPTVTYEAAVLANWEASSELGVTAAPTDLAAIESTFGTAHLFIDGCSDHDIVCHHWDLEDDRDIGAIPSSHHGGWCFSPSDQLCLPCRPWLEYFYDAAIYWAGVCATTFPACGDGKCRAWNLA